MIAMPKSNPRINGRNVNKTHAWDEDGKDGRRIEQCKHTRRNRIHPFKASVAKIDRTNAISEEERQRAALNITDIEGSATNGIVDVHGDEGN